MRTPMVTRTITTTKATVLCVNTESNEVTHNTFTMPRTFKTDKKLLAAIKDKHETDTLKVVSLEKEEVENKIYGMTEEKFIESAEELTAERKIAKEKTVNESEDNK